MSARSLTVRGVKAMLTRSGLNYSALTITFDPDVWVDLDSGVGHTSVKITGPEEDRRRARWALFEHGLANAPYPEFDMWSR